MVQEDTIVTVTFITPGDGAALSITFSCEEVPHEVWVHPGYLPDIPEELDPEFMIEGDPGWYQYLSGESGFNDPVPWQISVQYAQADTKMILLGTLEKETEDNWDGLQVTEVSISRDDLQENYVMLFDPEEGLSSVHPVSSRLKAKPASFMMGLIVFCRGYAGDLLKEPGKI